jgi:hypothetical protein
MTMLHSNVKIENEGSTDGSKAYLIVTEDLGGSVKIGNSAGAYIELKPDGDICIVPAGNGVVRLGGEDANKAILGNASGTTEFEGAVSSVPIISTMGGSLGIPDDPNFMGPTQPNGVFAAKVLVR